MTGLRIWDLAGEPLSRPAILDETGTTVYAALRERAASVAARLLGSASDLAGAPVAYLAAPGADHVAVQWGIWRAGGIAVSVGLHHPRPEIEYLLVGGAGGVPRGGGAAGAVGGAASAGGGVGGGDGGGEDPGADASGPADG